MMRKQWPFGTALLMTGALLGAAVILGVPAPDGLQAQKAGGQDLFGPYQVVTGWPKPLPDTAHSHDGWTWGSTAGVFAESPDKVWIAQRGELPLPPGAKPWTPYAALNLRATGTVSGGVPDYPQDEDRGWQRNMRHVIFAVDREGNLVKELLNLDRLFDHPDGRGPHQIKISPYDRDRHLWVIDDLLHVIYKISQEGKVVMQLGEQGVRGRGPNTFSRPTNIAFLPDGTFYITDGYTGTRVAKFAADGTFIKDWGMAPEDPANPGPNEWWAVHSIAISSDGRIFAMDRNNQRMQVFDLEGKFLTMWYLSEDHWPEGMESRPYSHEIFLDRETGQEVIWVSDGGTYRILKYDLDGNYLYGWGQPGGEPGRFTGPHQISADDDGNLYIAEVFNGRVQKFSPKPGADPSKLVGRQRPLMSQ
jgi:DNA-binding beta-propeller fold protein YncE